MKSSKVIGSIIKVVTYFGSLAGAIGGIVYFSQKSIKRESDLQKRYRAYYELSNQWLMNRNENKSLSSYFEENDIKSIAIYGMGTLGELFYEEVKKSEVQVKYFIDKNADELYCGMDNIPVMGFNDLLIQEKVDAVIVTPIFDYSVIQKDLHKVDASLNLISLEDIIFGI